MSSWWRKPTPFLPIKRVVVEVASFDIQKIKNPASIVRESQRTRYANVHHKQSRKTRGDRPDNLITLCETCHKAYHLGEIKPKIIRSPGFRAAAFMGIMRWTVYNHLKEKYPEVSWTYGYLTKYTRITAGIEKSHINDTYCIAGNLNANRINEQYLCAFKRKNNRQIHKSNFLKCGTKKKHQAPYMVKEFRLFDKLGLPGRVRFYLWS